MNSSQGTGAPSFSRESPRISVIIVAKNEDKNIEKCIASLLSQDYRNFEVIFVDGGSKDKTLHIVRSLSESNPITILEDPDGTIASGRNMGLRVAQGEIVAFVDGDCHFERDWLTRSVRHLASAEGLRLAGTGGPNVQVNLSRSPFSLILPTVQSTLLGSGGSVEVHVYHATRLVRSLSFRGAVFWFEVFRRVGFFDGRLQYCEDSELCQRVRNTGYKLLYADDLPTYHVVKYHSIGSFAKKMYRYGLGRGSAIRLHRSLVTWFGVAALTYFASFLVLSMLSLLGFGEVRLPVLFLAGFYALLVFGSSIRVAGRHGGLKAFGVALVSYMALHASYTAGLFVGLFKPAGKR